MLKRIIYLSAASLTVIALNGCLVAESRYLQKVGEADTLTRELDDLKQQHAKLTSENNALKGEYDRLKGEAGGLSRDKQALAGEKKELESLLAAKTDTLSRSISDLRQKMAALEAENQGLRTDIAMLQKTKEEKVREVSGTYEQLLQNMKNEIAQGQVTISELKGKLTVNMEAAILFDSGKADIKPDGLVILQKMVDTLKGVQDKAIRIEGHTDNVQINGALTRIFPTNWELSASRAINVTKYLQQQGLDPTNLSAAAFGENRPVADNDTREGRAKNRRIEITLVAKD
ncbi:OmpA family protein [Geobacter sp. SVR]|uniref:OmpA family protein n=1 Tax=Geobacter sp. SVR TaxID=2495594 RepID=UPI00143EFF21|nr:OmpA family protein [Geobacter sp. SVR]BCS52095.1 chemotaxis protein MotB [Geobacter sp. SVR]GCF86550.1 chemotaxis protein MotB [Geobacter sp. SVR]